MELHNHPIGSFDHLDRSERHRIPAALGPLSLHPAESGALLSGRLRSSRHNDEPEPASRDRPRRGRGRYGINAKAELEIELLHQKLDLLRETELSELITIIKRLESRIPDANTSSAAIR